METLGLRVVSQQSSAGRFLAQDGPHRVEEVVEFEGLGERPVRAQRLGGQ